VDATRPDDETRRFESEDAQARHEPDKMPSPEEEEAAERAGTPSEDVAEHYEEMAERGAKQEGEGRLP
jgi:hypothetical protein